MHGIETINRINEMASKSYHERQKEADLQLHAAELKAEGNPQVLSLAEELAKAQAATRQLKSEAVERLVNQPTARLLSLVYGNTSGATPMELALARKLADIGVETGAEVGE